MFVLEYVCVCVCVSVDVRDKDKRISLIFHTLPRKVLHGYLDVKVKVSEKRVDDDVSIKLNFKSKVS